MLTLLVFLHAWTCWWWMRVQVTTDKGKVFRLNLDDQEECDKWMKAILASLNQVQETTKAFEKLMGSKSGNRKSF